MSSAAGSSLSLEGSPDPPLCAGRSPQAAATHRSASSDAAPLQHVVGSLPRSAIAAHDSIARASPSLTGARGLHILPASQCLHVTSPSPPASSHSPPQPCWSRAAIERSANAKPARACPDLAGAAQTLKALRAAARAADRPRLRRRRPALARSLDRRRQAADPRQAHRRARRARVPAAALDQPTAVAGRLDQLRDRHRAGRARHLRLHRPHASARTVRCRSLPKVATTSFEVQSSGPPVARNLRTGQAFWQLLGNAGVRVVALDVPYSFPPDPMRDGRMLSGLGVPDLRETNSTFTYVGHRRDAPIRPSTRPAAACSCRSR